MADATSLLTAEEMSQRLRGIVSPERLLELAEGQLAPHYIVDGSVMFGSSETKEWVNHNLVVRSPGKHVGDGVLRVINVMQAAGATDTPPMSLRAMAGSLVPLSIKSVETLGCPGVYFLCMDGAVVYVGQSVNVFGRVGAHIGNKTFDSVFFARVPASDLDFVEGSLIRLLKPKYNHSERGTLIAPTGMYGTPSDDGAAIVEQMRESIEETPDSLQPATVTGDGKTRRTRRNPVRIG